MIMQKVSNSNFIEKGLSFFVPFLGLAWFLKKKNRLFNMVGFLVNLTLCVILMILLFKFIPLSQTRFEYFGKVPLCNLKEERGIHFGSFVFVFCYRCTFIILGGIISFFILFFKRVRIHYFYIFLSILFIIPCFLDGIIQLCTPYESTNPIRAITGFFAGASIAYFLYLPFKKWNLFL